MKKGLAWMVMGGLVAAGGAEAQTFSKTETIEYHDVTTSWVLGQVKRGTTNGIETTRTDYWPATALPQRTYAFGKPQQYFVYNTNGTLASVTDGNNHTTTLSNWKRGIPQTIQFPATPDQPSGATKSAVVNNQGWIDSVTDENGYVTSYGYDAMGRLASIVYPTGDSTGWNTTTFTFAPAGAVYGLAAGHWRQTIATGNARQITFFDAMWRPVVKETYDLANVNGTLTQTINRYDADGNPTFASYPQRTLDAAIYNTWGDPAQAPNALGVRTFYDALGRATRVEQDSEHGVLATTTEYLPGFKTRVTNPRGGQTLTNYRAYDQPSFDQPDGIVHAVGTPESAATEIFRDAFGKPTRLVRRNDIGSLRADRFYVYDVHQQLCKTIEPETGTTVMAYDAAGNLKWSAAGLSLPDTGSCNHNEAYASGRRVNRTYNTRNQLSGLFFPDGQGNQSWSYTPDGLPAQIITNNDSTQVSNAYNYNKRRLLTGESVSQPGWYTWGIGYAYDGNGSLSGQQYPTGHYVDYAPNALGQPTRAGSYATGVSYYPNGAIQQFTYGNGIVHTMTQNARQLPARSTDSAGAHDLGYAYDANANVGSIWDYAQDSGNGYYGRWMSYDNMDRLTAAGSCSFGGGCWHRFTYDALDNLKSWTLDGVKDHASYYYEPTTNRLTLIQNSTGAGIVGLSYDAQGNLANKNGQSYAFDFGNRLRGSPQEWYRYAGHGRRVLNWRATEPGVLSQYSLSGQLLYDENYRASGRKTDHYIYLNGSLVATREWNFDTGVTAVKYQHTDALGSPVAVTNEAGQVIDRTHYEPYGRAIGKPAYDGIGYTGHVQDGASGLTYMQQRYYDPGIGRFLSVDPVTADGSTGDNFNRYKYAANNPYRFTDPDGRKDREGFMNDVCGVTGCNSGSFVASGGGGGTSGSEGNSDMATIPSQTTTLGTVTVSGAGDTDGIARATAEPMRQYTQNTNFEACANFCPVLNGADDAIGYTATIVTQQSHAWCVTMPCAGGVSPHGANHTHPFRSYVGNALDVSRNSDILFNQRNPRGLVLSDADRKVFNIYLTTEKNIFNFLNNERRKLP